MRVQRPTRRRRGEPLVALAVLLGGWIGARAVLLDVAKATSPAELAQRPHSEPAMPMAEVQTAQHPAASRTAPVRPEPVPVREQTANPAADTAPTMPRIAGGHQLLWLAGLSMLPLPPEAALAQDRPPAPPRALAPRRAGTSARSASAPLRWSADGWIVWRQGGNGFNLPGAGLPGASVPSGAYGASQAGMVVRYRLAPTGPLRPTLYLRGSSALQAPRGEEVAAGLALRPLKNVPVAAMAEVRATRTLGGGVIVRPAAALVSEFPPLALPFAMRGEAYVQAGYVGGRDATPFIDGQARIERPLARLGPVELRAGGGVWGGAQSGAQRLDVGPTATLAMPLGPGGGRLSADWRFRIAGDAAPGSGPAITLSAGF